MSYLHNVRRYFNFTQEELRSLLITSLFLGFILSFDKWDTADLSVGIRHLIFFVLAAFFLLWAHVAVQKLMAIRLGLTATYEHYLLGLIAGVFLAFFSSILFFIPIFVTGALSFRAIDNLRIGRFRAVIPKNWELAIVAAVGVLGSLFLAIPFQLFSAFAGPAQQYLHWLAVTSYLIGLYSLIPLPLVKMYNPYAVYMSRLESLEGNTPGFDLLYASFIWYCYMLGFALVFGLLLVLRTPTFWTILGSFLGGFLGLYVFAKTRDQYAKPGP